jgi:predicted metal-dependent hydrolase
VGKGLALRNGLEHGIRLFNEGRYFEAHEVLEDAWRVAPEGHKKFLQGLTQLAVAFHHHSTGNLAGCRSVMARAIRNISAYPDGLLSMRTAEIVEGVAPCQQALDENKPLPALPKLQIHRN